MYILTCVYVYVYIHICIRIWIYAYIHTYIYTYMCDLGEMLLRLLMSVARACAHPYMRVYVCECVCVCGVMLFRLRLTRFTYIEAAKDACIPQCVCMCVCVFLSLHIDMSCWWCLHISQNVRVFVMCVCVCVCVRVCLSLQGVEDPYDALSRRSFSAKEPLISGSFCGKWPTKIRHSMSLRHTVHACICLTSWHGTHI